MAASGFAHNPTEWRHDNLPDWQAYPPLSDEVEGRRLMNPHGTGLVPARINA